MRGHYTAVFSPSVSRFTWSITVSSVSPVGQAPGSRWADQPSRQHTKLHFTSQHENQGGSTSQGHWASCDLRQCDPIMPLVGQGPWAPLAAVPIAWQGRLPSSPLATSWSERLGQGAYQ